MNLLAPNTACRVSPEGVNGSHLSKLHWAGLLVLFLFLGALSIFGWTSGIKEWLDPNRIAGFLQGFGILAPLIFMIIMTGAVVVSPIPSLPLDAAAGAVFGPYLGTVYSVLGAEAGALVSFIMARALGKEAITRLLRSDIGFCARCTEHHLFFAILISRLLPIFSFDLVSYGAGLTRISLRAFALATFLGMIPATFVFNYFGSGIFSGSVYTILLGGLAVLLFLLVPKWLKQYNPWGLFDRLEPHKETIGKGAR